MTVPLLLRNRNYRLLFSAGALTNLGDGMIALALPWLATLMTRDAAAIAAVAAAGRLPWLLFSVPAGVLIDRSDRRRLIAQADGVRALIVSAILLLALGAPSAGAVWVLAGLAFMLGSAEVLRDNAAQTVLPAIVAAGELEAANGQLWSAEQLTGRFIGPPLAGMLIAIGVALPFTLDMGLLVLAAALVWMITLPRQESSRARFLQALTEGVRFMRADPPLLRLAVVLGLSNFLAMATITVQVLFAQEVLGLSAGRFGWLLSVEAAGAILGSLTAPSLIHRFGLHACLLASIGTWALGYVLIGLSHHVLGVALALFAVMVAAMVWNVITVSWRQRRIPGELLGRVNSIYRFFGWGSMPLGALAGGWVVSALEPALGRAPALRAPYLLAGACCALLLVYAMARLRLR